MSPTFPICSHFCFSLELSVLSSIPLDIFFAHFSEIKPLHKAISSLSRTSLLITVACDWLYFDLVVKQPCILSGTYIFVYFFH